jgi:ferredoxin-NADP reductase
MIMSRGAKMRYEKIKAIVLENNQLTDDIFQIKCQLMQDWSFIAGQYILISKIFAGREIRRAYSVSSIPSKLPLIELSVRRYEEGLMSNFLTSMKKGDEFDFSGAYGDFTVNKRKNNQMVLIAIGCGIAPLKSMMEQWCYENDKDTSCMLFFGNRTIADMPYHGRFVELSHVCENFEYIPCLSRVEKKDYRYHGRVTDVLADFQMDFTEKEYFLSGNMEMIGQVSDVLIKKGVLRENIYFENIYPVLMKGKK